MPDHESRLDPASATGTVAIPEPELRSPVTLGRLIGAGAWVAACHLAAAVTAIVGFAQILSDLDADGPSSARVALGVALMTIVAPGCWIASAYAGRLVDRWWAWCAPVLTLTLGCAAVAIGATVSALLGG